MATVYVVKNDVVVHQEKIELASQRKTLLGALYRKYGTNRLFLKTEQRDGYKPYWERVEFIWNSRCTEIKHARMYLTNARDLPKVLQMMELVGAV